MKALWNNSDRFFRLFQAKIKKSWIIQWSNIPLTQQIMLSNSKPQLSLNVQPTVNKPICRSFAKLNCFRCRSSNYIDSKISCCASQPHARRAKMAWPSTATTFMVWCSFLFARQSIENPSEAQQWHVGMWWIYSRFWSQFSSSTLRDCKSRLDHWKIRWT